MNPETTELDAFAQRVIGIIARRQRVEPGRVTMDSTFAELSIDSLDGMELIFEFEEAFNLTIPDDAGREMKSVRQVVEALREVLAAKPADTPQTT